MLNYLRYYIFNLVTENPVKIFFFLITFLFFLWEDSITTKEIPKVDQYTNISWIDTTQKKIIYLNQVGVYTFYDYSTQPQYKFDEKSKVLTINYTEIENMTSKSIVVVIFFILALLSIVAILIEMLNEDIDFFDLERVRKKTLRKLVIMDEEGGVRYYHVMGRLIYEDTKSGNYYNINNIRDLNTIIENYMDNHKIFPKWSGTIQDKRDTILTKILS